MPSATQPPASVESFMEDLPEFARPMLTRLCAGDAKQEATVQRRVEKVLARLSAGDGLHDQYRK